MPLTKCRVLKRIKHGVRDRAPGEIIELPGVEYEDRLRTGHVAPVDAAAAADEPPPVEPGDDLKKIQKRRS